MILRQRQKTFKSLRCIVFFCEQYLFRPEIPIGKHVLSKSKFITKDDIIDHCGLTMNHSVITRVEQDIPAEYIYFWMTDPLSETNIRLTHLPQLQGHVFRRVRLSFLLSVHVIGSRIICRPPPNPRLVQTCLLGDPLAPSCSPGDTLFQPDLLTSGWFVFDWKAFLFIKLVTM